MMLDAMRTNCEFWPYMALQMTLPTVFLVQFLTRLGYTLNRKDDENSQHDNTNLLLNFSLISTPPPSPRTNYQDLSSIRMSIFSSINSEKHSPASVESSSPNEGPPLTEPLVDITFVIQEEALRMSNRVDGLTFTSVENDKRHLRIDEKA